MPQEINGLLICETRRDRPTRCKCCAPNSRALIAIPNGPNTTAYVCPKTRFAMVYGATGNAIATGFYTGSPDGV